MTAYDPFARGPHPVGVRTVTLDDPSRDRRLVAEVWYPAAAAHAGADVAAATRDRYQLAPGFPAWQLAVRDAAAAGGDFPLAVFSHGFAGHRRQSTFFTTHLASHGWVVVSVDHTGNTFADLMTMAARPPAEVWRTSMAARPLDVQLVIDAAADGRLGAAPLDVRRVAMTGHSFGGWSAVRVVAGEPRIAAVVALAPAIGIPALRAAIDLAWTRAVPTAIVAAARDSLLPVAGIESVFAEVPRPAMLAIVDNADHMHFCDGARQIHELFRMMPIKLVEAATELPPFDQLAPARHGHEAAVAIGLARLESVIGERADAGAWLDRELDAALAARGIGARIARRAD